MQNRLFVLKERIITWAIKVNHITLILSGKRTRFLQANYSNRDMTSAASGTFRWKLSFGSLSSGSAQIVAYPEDWHWGILPFFSAAKPLAGQLGTGGPRKWYQQWPPAGHYWLQW
jgi:hypothetical protein